MRKFSVLVISSAVALLVFMGWKQNALGQAKAEPGGLLVPLGPNSDCMRMRFTHRPGWTLSGAWSADASALLMVDVLHNKLLRYSSSGSQGPVASLVDSRVVRTSTLRASPGQLLLEMDPGRFVTLGPDLAVMKIADIFADGVKDSWGIRSAFTWAPAGGDLVEFGNICALSSKDETGCSDWKRVFLRVPLDRPADYSIFKLPDGSMPVVDDREMEFYRLGNPYITSIGKTGYILRMTGEGSILAAPSGASALSTLGSYRFGQPLPSLPPFQKLSDLGAVFQAEENSSMPTGIFGWKDSLFVVERRMEGAELKWQISKIDPITDTLIGTVTLPTLAPHLTVVPGSQNWAFVEKSHAVSFGDQEISGALLIPSGKFDQAFGENLCN